MIYLILFILLSGTLGLVPGSPILLRNQRELILPLALMAGVGAYAWTITRTGALLILYVVWTLFRGANATLTQEILCYVLLFALMIQTREYWLGQKNLIYDGILIVAGVNLLFQVCQLFDWYFIVYPVPGQPHWPTGLMANPDDVFALYMLCIPAALRPRRWQALIPVTLAGLLFASPVFSSSTQYIVKDHLAGRVAIWDTSIKATMPVRWFGWGFNQYDKVIPLLTSWKYLTVDERKGLFGQVRDWQAITKVAHDAGGRFRQDKSPFAQAHNEFVEGFFTLGLVGLLLGLGFLVHSFVRGWRHRDKIPALGLATSCVASLAFFTWHIVPLALITVVYLGLIYADRRMA